MEKRHFGPLIRTKQYPICSSFFFLNQEQDLGDIYHEVRMSSSLTFCCAHQNRHTSIGHSFKHVYHKYVKTQDANLKTLDKVWWVNHKDLRDSHEDLRKWPTLMIMMNHKLTLKKFYPTPWSPSVLTIIWTPPWLKSWIQPSIGINLLLNWKLSKTSFIIMY